MTLDPHALWTFLHLLLFAYWLGADVGVWLVMAFIRDSSLPYPTRVTLIRLGFAIDVLPRLAFALILPVGAMLARDLGLATLGPGLVALAWSAGIAWAALHLTVLIAKGRPLARQLMRVNRWWEGISGLFFVGIGAWSLVNDVPVTVDWFALKLLLFGLIYWVVLAIDVYLQPFTTLLRLGPDGSTPGAEAAIRRMTHQTMVWALLLYGLIIAIAFLGTVQPF
jgi:hypothetical protein